jgi:hypothetical protein
MRLDLPHRGGARPLALVLAAVLVAGCAATAAVGRLTSTTTSSSIRSTGPSSPARPMPHRPGRLRLVAHQATTTTGAPGDSQPRGTAPSPAPSCSVPALQPPASGLVVGRVTAVGDSIMIDIEPYLQTDVGGVVFDAYVGQQWSSGISDVQQQRADGQLGSVVVIELGTNGPISMQLFDQMMSELRGVSRVVFVTNYVPDSWQNPNNAIIEAGAAQYKNVAVANWYALAAANPGWLCSDGTHLSCGGPGASEMAALIAKCV